MRKLSVVGLAFLFIASPLSEASPQSAGTVVNYVNGKRSTAPIPLDQLYASFFRYQNHLDKAAAAHEREGKDGRWLSEHFEHELNFNEADINIIRTAATRIAEHKLELDAKAKVIVGTYRAARKAGTLPADASAPALPALLLLDHDKQETLTQQISLMNDRLGPQKAGVLAKYLQETFAGPASFPAPPQTTPKEIVADGPK